MLIGRKYLNVANNFCFKTSGYFMNSSKNWSLLATVVDVCKFFPAKPRFLFFIWQAMNVVSF